MGSLPTLTVVQDPSSHADLNALTAGESVTFDVNLLGLDVLNGQTLGTLEGTVVFNGSLLGQPLSISPGTIVPDISGFLTAASAGVSDATYSSLFSNSNALITTNGTFFSFALVVQPGVTGPGILSLDPNNGGFVGAFDANNDPVDITFGADLPFLVGSSAVPEPSTGVIVVIALTLMLARAVFARACGSRVFRADRTNKASRDSLGDVVHVLKQPAQAEPDVAP